MKIKKFSMATLAGGIVYSALAIIIYSFLLFEYISTNSNYYVNSSGKSQYMLLVLFLSQLLLSAMLTLILSKWRGANRILDGVKVGTIFGFLIGLSTSLDLYATTNLTNLTITLLDPFIMAFRSAFAGGAIVLILNSSNEKSMKDDYLIN